MNKEQALKRNTWIVALVGIIFLIFIFLRVVFPSYTYLFNEPDSRGIMFWQDSFDEGENEKGYVLVTPFYDYNYYKIKIWLELKVDGPESSFKNYEQSFKVYRDYVVQGYPIAEETINNVEELDKYLFFENNTKFPNGTLFSHNDAIHFISKGEYQSFIFPSVFERLGFDWDNVEKIDGESFAELKNGKQLNFITSHPNGTILKTKEGKLFLVWEKKRIPIASEEILKTAWPKYHAVEVLGDSVKYFGECELLKNNRKKIKCEVGMAEEGEKFSGQSYLIEIPNEVNDNIVSGKMKFDVLGNFDTGVAKMTLKFIKDSLYTRYIQR